MDEKQAESAADAILEPERQRQHEEQERSRARKARTELHRRRRRLAAWFLLSGGVVGAAVAYFTGHQLFRGIITGAVAGALVGWLVAYIKVRAVANKGDGGN